MLKLRIKLARKQKIKPIDPAGATAGLRHYRCFVAPEPWNPTPLSALHPIALTVMGTPEQRP
jgi:hypothetical protein